ncbi:MAG: hypothetical protein COV66_08015 [Nitrospinae bacterium CG11_big_fil_rev_8_21_14_0_20_45_15]|nr:MAG: hypothetical protein COV66_08015 [Nitrospinae bacterium CG11_big_fil_rev_8_21_14_0_20_45_15]
MAVGFYYPNKSAPTAQWVPSTQPVFPLQETVDYPYQLKGETAGGALYVQEKGPLTKTVELNFARMTEADRDSALAFFSAVKKSFLSFEYESPSGILETVRWMNAFEFQHVVQGKYSATIQLRKEV